MYVTSNSASGSKYHDLSDPIVGSDFGPDPLNPDNHWANSVENQEHVRQSTTSRRGRSRRTLRRAGVAITLVASVLAGAAAAAPAAAAGEAPWQAETVDGSFGSDRRNYDDAVEPGDRLEDALLVVNDGVTPIDLVIYAADAFTTATGQLDLRTRAAVHGSRRLDGPARAVEHTGNGWAVPWLLLLLVVVLVALVVVLARKRESLSRRR